MLWLLNWFLVIVNCVTLIQFSSQYKHLLRKGFGVTLNCATLSSVLNSCCFSQLFFCYSELCDFCSVQFSIHTLQGTVCCLGITTQHSKRNRIYFRCLVVQWVVLVVISLSKLFFCLRSREWILNTNISCQAKPSQSVNRGRRLTRSASRRPPVCYPFPRLTALLGSVTDS